MISPTPREHKLLNGNNNLNMPWQFWFEETFRSIFYAVFKSEANVKYYGAKGDGTTDDYLAIFNAHTFALSNQCYLIFPKGTYRIGSDLSLNVRCILLQGAYLVPDSGITISLGESCQIESRNTWNDTSNGGSFSFGAGSFENKMIDRVTTPTGARTINWGYPGNTINENSSACYILGGVRNQIHSIGSQSDLSSILGAYDNVIGDNAEATTICGGAHHRVNDSASHATICGGSFQVAGPGSDYATLGGGTQNEVYSRYSTISGGQENTAGDVLNPDDATRGCFVGGGAQNSAIGLRSACVGGFSNSAEGEESFIGAGQNNTATGAESVITGGAQSTAAGTRATVVGGELNTASGNLSVASGSSAKAQATYAQAHGEFLEANGNGSWATGARSKADKRGQRAHAAGYFASKGDAQISDLVARVLTSANETKDLDLQGSLVGASPITIPDDTTWKFTVDVVARNIDSSENGMWEFKGGIKKDGTVGSTAFVGSVLKTTINQPTDWVVNVLADTTNGALQIQVIMGASVSEDVRWVAGIKLAEVAG